MFKVIPVEFFRKLTAIFSGNFGKNSGENFLPNLAISKVPMRVKTAV